MSWRFRIKVAWSVLRGRRGFIDPYMLPIQERASIDWETVQRLIARELLRTRARA